MRKYYVMVDGVEHGSDADPDNMWSKDRASEYAALNGVEVKLYNDNGVCCYTINVDGVAVAH